MVASDLPKPRRIELILNQLDALPTLPAVAAQLLRLTADEHAHAHQVVSLVSSDPALTARLISMCRTADKGVHQDVITVDQAVVLLGFSAVRNAVLSLKIVELFDCEQSPENHTKTSVDQADNLPGLDREGLWTHALAVGILAELIAKAHPGQQDLSSDQAFVCGLLHDVGKLALDRVLPRSYARVIEVCRQKRCSIAEVERSVIGIDHHTAGKRLAEQWGLPHVIQDCIWLHGSPYEALPNLAHRRMVGLIALSNTLVRQLMLGFSGNHGLANDADLLIEQLGLSKRAVDSASEALVGELERRSTAMGITSAPSERVLMQSIQKANDALGRLNQQLETRSRQVSAQSRVLEVIAGFHADARPGRSVQDVLASVLDSADSLFGQGFYGILYPSKDARNRDEWLLGQRSIDQHASRFEAIEPPPSAPDLTTLRADASIGMQLMGLLPWISDHLLSAEDLRRVQLLPLASGWGTAALLIHDRQQMPAWSVLHPLLATWGGSIAAAAQHDGARRLSEELNDANLALAQAQHRLTEQASMARLGEMAAGAAHEMNNPLAVIAGRAQLLMMSLQAGSREQQAADLIHRESHKLSDLITALHLFSDPPLPDRKPTEMLSLVNEAIAEAHEKAGKRGRDAEVSLSNKDRLPIVYCDPALIRRALVELLLNAMQSHPASAVHVSAWIDPIDESLVLQVRDDGEGMNGRTLSHAFDPFFSAKSAGRQVGMGLPRAQQIALSHSGSIELDSAPDQGTTATLRLPLRGSAHAD